MFRFESESALLLLWILPFLVLGTILSSHYSKKRLVKSFGAKLSPFLISSVSIAKRKLKLFLQVLTLTFMIVAFARPQAGQSKQDVKSEGVEVMILVDVSESMLADDLRPSRLEQAKVDISKLIDLLSGNKIGLIAFAGSAALLSPLTSDPGSLKLFVESLSTNSVSSQGTNFHEALEDAKAAFEHGGVDKDSGSQVTRVILIMSDGEDHEPGALDYIKKITTEGIRVFSLAYGTEKGAPIPQRDSLGYLKGYKKDHSGNTILTTVKGEALQALAQAGKGSFFFASVGSAYLKSVVEDINKLEKTQFDTQSAVQYDEKFQWVLIWAFIFGMLEIFLGDRRTAFRIWNGRFEVPPV